MAAYVVRCGVMKTLHVMQSRQEYARGTQVIARTPRGLETGEVLCTADDRVTDQLVEALGGRRPETDGNPYPGGSIQREMSEDDHNELAHITAKSVDEANRCFEVIRELDLPMDLVDVERVFGGERMVIYYLSESRVDFRELVKRLAHEFQTRVEMRQIGVRDEAKLLADYGDCGKPVCCNTHLVKMPPVSMKMAKLQKATLDPNKISGRCGRLKCCLRYEYDTYEEHRKELPKIGSDVVTSNGRGRVLNQELLSRQLLVQMEDNRRTMIHVDEVLSVIKPAKRSPKKPRSDSSDNE
ncbi:MAG: stage 0 sporulation family protein [Aureliella sp.]